MKAGTEQGLYGKAQLGMALVDGNTTALKVSDGLSLSIGLGGGFLFPISDSFEFGPEVQFRHLTTGGGGNLVSIGALAAFRF